MARKEGKQYDVVRVLGEQINMALNETKNLEGIHTGFALIVVPMEGKDSPFNDAFYLSNVERQRMTLAMRKMAARLEGWPIVEGNA